MYFVDQSLRAIRLTELYNDDSTSPAPVRRPDEEPTSDAPQDTAIPVSPDGQLVVGQLYESSVEPQTRYYLPQYQVHAVDGRYQASLRWTANPQVPTDPIGMLTVDLAAQTPTAPGFTLFEIAHTAVARLRYRQPIDASAQPGIAAADQFAAEWVNVDLQTSGMTRLTIARVNDTTLTFHGYGKCQPDDCDWGVVEARVRGDRAFGVYDFGWKQTRIMVKRMGAQLIAEVSDDYSDADGRKDRAESYTLEIGQSDQALPPFSYELGALNPIAPGVRRCQLPIYDHADFDRIYRVMTEERFAGLLEIRCFATVGHRSWRQVVAYANGRQESVLKIARIVEPTQISATPPATPQPQQPPVTPGIFTPISTIPGRVVVNPAPIQVVGLPIGPIGPIFRPRDATLSAPSEASAEPVVFQVLPIGLPQQASDELFATTEALTLGDEVSAATTMMVARAALPVMADTVFVSRSMPINTAMMVAVGGASEQALVTPLAGLLARSDLRLRTSAISRAAIPIGALVDRRGEPVLMRLAVESSQTTPFCFLRDTNSYMFELPGGFTPTTKDTLLPETYRHSDGREVRFYRDEAKKLFYYQPTEFLLARTARPSASASFQPYLLATMQNIITTAEGAGDTVTDCQINLTYQLLPSLDQELRELAAAELQRRYGETPRFLPLNAVSATIALDALPGVQHEKLELSFEHGIAGQIELSEEQFKQVLALLTSRPDMPAGALTGTVSATLLDSTPVAVPLRISLKETAGPLFDVAINGLVQGTTDTYQIALTNQVENPVQLNTLKPVPVGSDAVAYPQGFAPTLVAPGQAAHVAYQLVPATQPLRAIDPQLSGSVLISDYKLLWRKLIVKQGFVSDTFTITVGMDSPVYFAESPNGRSRLSMVKIVFDCGPELVLTPEQQSATVELSRGYLAMLLSDFSAYSYAQTCSYDTGEIVTSEWIRTDANPLSIVPTAPEAS